MAARALSPVLAALHARLDAIEDGAEPADLAAAEAAVAPLFLDDSWLRALLRRLANDALRGGAAQPDFAALPAPRSGLVLVDRPSVQLTIGLVPARPPVLDRSPPNRPRADRDAGIGFSGRVSWVRFVACGGGRLRLWTVAAAGPAFTAAQAPPCREEPPRRLADGDTIRLDGRTTAYALEDATRDAILLVATFNAGADALQREHDRATGRHAAASAVRPGASRTALLLSLLRQQGRRDAGDCFDAASQAAEFFLRWDAMREYLALDGAAALPRLRIMAADDPHPEVRDRARRVLKQLASAPPCPA